MKQKIVLVCLFVFLTLPMSQVLGYEFQDRVNDKSSSFFIVALEEDDSEKDHIEVDLHASEEGEFTADVTPSHRDTYYIDYDWWVWYFEEPPKRKKDKDGLRLPPTEEWLKLSEWDGYQTIEFSSSYYSFKLKSIVTDEAYNHTVGDSSHTVIVTEK